MHWRHSRFDYSSKNTFTIIIIFPEKKYDIRKLI